MAILSTVARPTKPAAIVTFDATTFRNTAIGFAKGLTETLAEARERRRRESLAFDIAMIELESHSKVYGRYAPPASEFSLERLAWLPHTKVEYGNADQAAFAAGNTLTAAEYAATLAAQVEEAVRVDARDAWAPSGKRAGYTRTDAQDFAAGRTISAEEMEARWEAEDEVRLMASMPAEAYEEAEDAEWARPFAGYLA